MPIPETSRIYFLAGTSHVPGPFPPRKLNTQNLANPSSYWPLLHAMFDALDAWAREGIEPPPSNIPHISDGTLVPVIPSAAEREGSPSQAPGRFLAVFAARNDKVRPYGVYMMDVGPQWNRGITQEPPKVVGEYPVLVPLVGSDGNEIAGIHMPWVGVPLATWTGWNLRDPKVGFPDRRQNFIGSYIPFSSARIHELYRDENEYLGRYTAATLKLIDERFLSPYDLNATLRFGQRLWAYASGGGQ